MTATLEPSLTAAIAAGAMIVTPNNRLARRLGALHDDAQRAAGLRTWQAPSVLPWRTWVGMLCAEYAERTTDHPIRLLSPAQTSYLWRRIIAAETSGAAVRIDVRSMAALAEEAWTSIHAYGAGGESWRGFAPQGDDEAAFVRWADRYAAALARIDADDASRVADMLARAIGSDVSMRGRTIALAGFVERSAQQQRLLDALGAAGAQIAQVDPLSEAPAHVVRIAGASPVDEIVAALEWARARSLADASATIAIAVENLSERRDEIVALAEDILCPHLQWPGREDAPRPYNVSLGRALADVPIVATALDLVSIAHAPLPLSRAAALARSPYLAGATTRWPQRAGIERTWLRDGRREIDWTAFAAKLARDPVLASRLPRIRGGAMAARRATPRLWVDAWRAWLADAGWPGDRALASAEYQARVALDELFATFASLAPVATELGPLEAVAALRALGAETVFQPESPRAPIQILGLLEAAGMPFDALWVAGLSAQRWPGPPRPHPLLPLAWQHAHDIPHSSAAHELAYARALTDQLVRAAPSVVLSHAQNVDDHRCLPSSLTAHWPLATLERSVARTASAIHRARPALERVDDRVAPPVASDQALRGGTSVIEAQSECPFRAVAKHRLRAEPWPTASAGLAPWERGRLMHAAIAALWRELRTHTALVALSAAELDARIAQAVAEAMATLDGVRRRELPPLVLASEPARLAQLIREWLDDCERERPPFTVQAVESPVDLTLSGLTLSFRLDRVDELEAGGVAIIDYKTGAIPSIRRWFESRPAGTQLGLYALAWRAARAGMPLRAVAFASIAPGAIKPLGIAADERAWPALAKPPVLGVAGESGWAAIESSWLDMMTALARDFARGEATVDPRERAICKNCGLQSLCRIDAVANGDEANGDE